MDIDDGHTIIWYISNNRAGVALYYLIIYITVHTMLYYGDYPCIDIVLYDDVWCLGLMFY